LGLPFRFILFLERLATYAYGYDLGNRLTAETLNSGAPTSYAYDTTNQLTTVVNASGTTTYGYDLNGNRTNTGYVTGSENQLTADATYSYTYDAEGNQITKTSKSTLEQWTFGYDNLNHMTSAIDKNSSGVTLTYATYVYDVFGNRIEKDVWTQSGGSTTTTRMGYDGCNIWADLNGSNLLQTRYLRGDEIDQLIARIVATGTPTAWWYLPDRLGSIRNITDANGNLIDTNRLRRLSQIVDFHVTLSLSNDGIFIQAQEAEWKWNSHPPEARIRLPKSHRYQVYRHEVGQHRYHQGASR
jgi:YD repeat-containing protein